MGNLEEFNSVPKKPIEGAIHAKKHISLQNYNNTNSYVIKKSLET